MADFFNRSITIKLNKNKNKNILKKIGYLLKNVITLGKILFVIKYIPIAQNSE